MPSPDPLSLLAEPKRQEILRLVWGRELTAGQIAACFDVTFGAISQHLALLREAGLVRRRREGRKRLYTADRERLGPLAPALEAMWAQRPPPAQALQSPGGVARRARRGPDVRTHEPHDRGSGR
jgi:DNA-binding transcriptional ArsR family regulator